jgi:hypothetical protein
MEGLTFVVLIGAILLIVWGPRPNQIHSVDTQSGHFTEVIHFHLASGLVL